MFVGYLLSQLEATKEAFTVDDFVDQLRDTEFVGSERYAELLVTEIPALKRGEVIEHLYRERHSIDLKRASFVVSTLLAALSDQQLATYLAAVSEDMRSIRDEVSIRTTMQLLTPTLWPRLGEVSRLRIETKLIKSIEGGTIQSGGRITGALGTWAGNYLKSFTLRPQAETMVVGRMLWSNTSARDYLSEYFMWCLPEFVLDETNIQHCIEAIAIAVRADEQVTKRKLISHVSSFPDIWQEKLAEALEDCTDPINPALKLRDGAPFLTLEDDDIPF